MYEICVLIRKKRGKSILIVDLSGEFKFKVSGKGKWVQALRVNPEIDIRERALSDVTFSFLSCFQSYQQMQMCSFCPRPNRK
jgi:hypothetical protein